LLQILSALPSLTLLFLRIKDKFYTLIKNNMH